MHNNEETMPSGNVITCIPTQGEIVRSKSANDASLYWAVARSLAAEDIQLALEHTYCTDELTRSYGIDLQLLDQDEVRLEVIDLYIEKMHALVEEYADYLTIAAIVDCWERRGWYIENPLL